MMMKIRNAEYLTKVRLVERGVSKELPFRAFRVEIENPLDKNSAKMGRKTC